MKNEYLNRIKNSRTLNTYKNYKGIVNLLSSSPTPQEIDKLIGGWKERKLSPNTIKTKLIAVAQYIKFVNGRQPVKHFNEIMDQCSYRGEEKIIRVPDADNIINQSTGKYKLIFSLAAKCGLRVSEITNLEWSDIGKDFILIRNSKSKKERQIPIPNSVWKLISEYKSEKENGIGKLFSVSANQIWREVKKYNTHPHALRHFYATTLLNKDVNLEVVRQVLGHSSLKTTQKYLHIDGKKIKEDVLGVIK